MAGETKKEMDKVWSDVRKQNFGLYDQELKKRINPKNLAMFFNGETKKMRQEIALRTDLVRIKEIYKKKFKDKSPYEIELFNKDEGLFVERMIRAVEICTLSYALNVGGALNNNERDTIIKGRKKFVWEA